MKFLVVNFLFFFSFTSVMAQEIVSLEVEEGSLSSGRFFVKCNFDNELRRCFVDTGSSQTSVFSDDVFSNYPGVRREETSGASGEVLLEDVIHVNSLKVGQTATEIKEVLRRNSADVKYKAFSIGANALVPFNVSLDLQSKEMVLSRNRLRRSNLLELILIGGSVPSFLTEINGKEIQSIIDTGAQLTTVSQTFVNENPSRFQFIQDSSSTDSTGNMNVVKIYRSKEMQIGPISLRKDFVVALDFTKLRNILNEKIHVILGYNTISRHRVHLDFPAAKYFIEELAR